MGKAKTQPTQASVDDYLASRASPTQLADCRRIMAMLARVTREAPRMWGPSIVGYGSYSYARASGGAGESCVTGLAVRGKELVVYLVAGGPEQPRLLARLGKHRIGKSCLYLKRLAEVDAEVLEMLVANSVAEVKRRHPPTTDTRSRSQTAVS